METITITKDEFKELATEVSKSIVTETSEDKNASPLVALTEVIMHMQLISELTEKLFGEEEKSDAQAN